MSKARVKRKMTLGQRAMSAVAGPLAPGLFYRWMKWFERTGFRDDPRVLARFNTAELESRIGSGENPSIIALWHNRLLFGPPAYSFAGGENAAVMVSRGPHGEMINKVLARFENFTGVRGSASARPGVDKGGREALEDMIEMGRRGMDLVLTVDGPQGPCYKAKSGAIWLARETGLPIYPLSASARPMMKIKSWDRLRIPFPYSRFVFRAGDPIEVPAEATAEAMEEKRLELERSLMELTVFVDSYFDYFNPG